MIAARFRLVGWVAGCAGAALVCYMASQSVAAERSALLRVDGQIADTKADIARLDTEITARSRAGQVENWNGVLELKAARPVQYVQNGFQLASLARGEKLPLDPQVTGQFGVRAAAYQAPASNAAKPAAAPVAPEAAPEVHEPVVRAASLVRPKVDPLDEAAPALIKTSYVKEPPLKPVQAPALTDSRPAREKAKPADAAKPKSAKAVKPQAEKIVAAAQKPAQVAAKPKADRPAPKLADADTPKARPKKAKVDDSLLPADLGKLIAAENKAKPHKSSL